MAHPLMPKATAVWLVENTALTFEQIAAFCGLHQLEVQAIADDEVAVGMQGLDPIAAGELTQDEIDRCAGDADARLVMAKPDIPLPKARTKGARYTPVAKRQDRPDAIAWLLRAYPEMTDAQISKLIGTTKPTINAIRDRSHWNMPNIAPQNPVGLGLCTAADLEKVVAVARARAGIVHESKARPIEGAPETYATTLERSPVAKPSAPDSPLPAAPAPGAVIAAGEARVPAKPDVLMEAEKVFGTAPEAAPESAPKVDSKADDTGDGAGEDSPST